MFSLTNREIEILQAASTGLTDKEIAEKFNRSFRTVNAHVRNACMKLNVNKRSAAICIATQNGLIKPTFENQKTGISTE